MNPRYKSSQKWTALPEEFCNQIKSLFQNNFKKDLGNNKHILVNGKIFQKEILLRVGIHTEKELRHFNFESSIDIAVSTKNLDESLSKENNKEELGEDIIGQVSIAIDAIATLMHEYFQNDCDLELPYTWTEMSFDKKTVWIQHSSTNTDLEEQANKLLGLDSDSDLVHESEEIETSDLLDSTEEQFDQFMKDQKLNFDDNQSETSNPQDQSHIKNKKKDDLH